MTINFTTSLYHFGAYAPVRLLLHYCRGVVRRKLFAYEGEKDYFKSLSLFKVLGETGGTQIEMKKVIKMREMANNQEGIVKKILAASDMGRRIREMGLVPHARIQIQGRAPLKDPVAVKIKDFTLTLRNNEADNILVEVDAPDPLLERR